MEFEVLTKENFSLLCKALDIENPKCNFCNKKITKNNFGIIHRDYWACNNILCQVEFMDKVQPNQSYDEVSK